MSIPATPIASTEPPSLLQPGLEPVKLKYIALPTPLPESYHKHKTVTAGGAFLPPCRRCLQEALPGDVMDLTSYDPFPAASITPYRGSGPIFVHANGCQPFDGAKLPDGQLRRLLSLRAYDDQHMLAAAEVIEGSDLERVAGSMLADQKAEYVNVHNAKPGCFAARIERA